MRNFHLRALDPMKDSSELFGLTYPRYHKWLKGADPKKVKREDYASFFAVAAYDNQTPVGLVLLVKLSTGDARLLSIMVSSPHRRNGIGVALLNAAIAQAKAWDCDNINALYGSRSNREAFLALLTNMDWGEPEFIEFRLAGYADWTLRMGEKWMRFLDRLQTGGYSVTPWAEIDADDRKLAEALEAEQTGHLIDFQTYEPAMDPAISIAIRKDGELVGYILGETPEGGSQSHYVSGYVRKDLQNRGWLLAGLDSVCKLQAAKYGPRSVATYETFGSNLRMIEFMKRRLTPVTIWMDERYKSQKKLMDCRCRPEEVASASIPEKSDQSEITTLVDA